MKVETVPGTEVEVNIQKAVNLVILSIILPVIGYAQQDLLIYSEVSSGFFNEKESDNSSLIDVFFGINNQLILNNFDLSLNSNIYHSINENTFPIWDINCQAGHIFEQFNLLFTSGYKKNIRDSIEQFTTDINIFRYKEEVSKYVEYALITGWNYVDEYKEFSNIDLQTYYMLKKYYRNIALHHDINLNFKFFPELTSPATLLSAQYQIKISFSLFQRIGMNLGYAISHNFLDYDTQIYENYELYDEFCYDTNRFFSEITINVSEIIFKPNFAFVHKKYLETAVEEGFNEVSIIFGLYSDVILPVNLMLYFDGFYQIINEDVETSTGFEVSTGIKYQFDIFSSQNERRYE